MSQRIGDRDLAATSLPETTRTRAKRLSAALATPLGILLTVPAIVLAVGIFLTLLGQHAIEASSVESGSARFTEQTDAIVASVGVALSNADPVLDRVAEIVRQHRFEDPMPPFAHAIRGVMNGRAGLSYVSISFPDGSYQGGYLDYDGVLRFQQSTIEGDHTAMNRWDYEGFDLMKPRETAETKYDPRKRSFYRLAVAAGHRIWTPPYAFFESHYTGVSRVEPLYDPDGSLHAVVTADFDVDALSASVTRSKLPGARTLLYTDTGVVLVYPEGAAAIAKLPLTLDAPITYRDVDDPILNAFFEGPVAAKVPEHELLRFTAGGRGQVAMTSHLVAVPELGWRAASIVPEDVFFSAREAHSRRSLVAAAIALLLAIGVSFVFARHILQARKDVARAETAAAAATERAKELGSYRLVEKLGAGGMGEVWRGEHRLLARQAAIKLIRREVVEKSGLSMNELRERFQLEAQTLAMLRSRHTIELFDYGVTADGTFFFVMELLDGIDIETMGTKFGPQPAARVISFLIQACKSLAEAHEAGLVHRDVKPANLFACRIADELDVVKVLDFGLVHAAGRAVTSASVGSASSSGLAADPRLTQVGRTMGTPGFMAPEQGQATGEVDGRADLYALACTAVWLLSGRLLFEATTSDAMILQHMVNPLPPFREWIDGPLPAELESVLRDCLAKSPADRPASARVVVERLQNIRVGAASEWTEARARRWWESAMAGKDGPSPPSVRRPVRA